MRPCNGVLLCLILANAVVNHGASASEDVLEKWLQDMAYQTNVPRGVVRPAPKQPDKEVIALEASKMDRPHPLKREAPSDWEPPPLHRTLKKPQVLEAYVINLDSRTDRWQRVQSKLQHAHFTFERFSAIKLDTLNGSAIPSNSTAFQAFSKYIDGKPLSEHMIGATTKNRLFVASVFASHMSIYEKVAATNYSAADLDNVIMIFEDDVNVRWGWEDIFRYRMAYVPEDWDIVRLGVWGETRLIDMQNKYFYSASPPFKPDGTDAQIFYAGMQATMVRPRTIKKVIEFLRTEPLNDIDEMVTAFPTLKSYVMTDNVGEVDHSQSDHPAL